MRRLVLFILLVPATASAYRPFDGTDADVAPYGEFELETGALLTAPRGHTLLSVPSLVLNFGIVPRVELVLQGTLGIDLRAGNVWQVTDTALLFKIVLRKGVLQDQSGVSIATEIGPLLPEVNGACCGGLSAALIVSARFGPMSAHFNAQVEDTITQHAAGFASVIVEGPQAWRVRPVLEPSVWVEAHVPSVASVLAGAIWRVSDALSIDGGARVATNAIEARLGITVATELIATKHAEVRD